MNRFKITLGMKSGNEISYICDTDINKEEVISRMKNAINEYEYVYCENDINDCFVYINNVENIEFFKVYEIKG
ncbi:hypothetical protein [Clostridium senegalense]